MQGNIDFSNKFFDIIEAMWSKERSEITFRIMDLEKNQEIENPYNITHIDVSKTDPFAWSVKLDGEDEYQDMKIGRVIRGFFGMEAFNQGKIAEFITEYHEAAGMSGGSKYSTPKIGGPGVQKPKEWGETDDDSYGTGGTLLSDQLKKKYGYYNSRSGGSSNWNSFERAPRKLGEKIDIPEFKYNPKSIRDTFISLCTRTYPHGHEEEVLEFLPELERDSVGNYFKIIGKSTTMFTCHLDTADRAQRDTHLYMYKEGEDDIIQTDGTSILGADDKAGTAIMLHMMDRNIPGIYYFFIGEERGGIGSHALAHEWVEHPEYKHIKRCISFDRRNYHSVITSQYGVVCCSDEFGTHLAKELNKSGMKYSLDPTGVYTDSASFMELIPECTNIAVGYFNEHTHDEIQNISHLERLGKACLSVDWEGLTVRRKVGYDETIFLKYSTFLKEFKNEHFSMSHKFVSGDNCIYIKMEMDEPLDLIHEDFLAISILMNKHKIDPDILFEDEYLKIELK